MFKIQISHILLALPVVLSTVMVFSSLDNRSGEELLPIYMQRDSIANRNHASVDLKILSSYRSDTLQIDALKKDYLNIWSHLNHLFATNNIVVGKEYYTEDWFKLLEKNYSGKKNFNVERQDIEHELSILDLSTDDLVCTTNDTITFCTRYGHEMILEKYSVHMALLFQGDHWRIDAAHYNKIEY